MTAVLSPCRIYRYSLTRVIKEHPNGPTVVLIGVNPSTADENNDDATIRKEMGFGKRLGWGRIIKVNLFPLRATDVRELAGRGIPPNVWLHNIGAQSEAFRIADLIIPCWGSRTKIPLPKSEIGAIIFATWERFSVCDESKVKCFGVTKSGDPRHPLMLAYNTPLVPCYLS